MKAYLLTGVSRGLGEALAEQLLAKDSLVVCVSRSDNPRLKEQAEAAGATLAYLQQDLSDTDQLEPLMDRMLSQLPVTELSSLYLIHNAGVLQPIAPASKSSGEDIALNITVNLTAPMIMTSTFLRMTEHLTCNKRVLHISSGAGRKPYAGWSSYCAAKAGLDHFTRCVGLEEEKKAHGARIASLAPGVIDTAMQSDIRSSSAEDFPQLDRFVQLKASGQLTQPSDAAAQVLRFLHSEDMGFGTIADVRELQ
jgi:benzil reductase ((S)-benzoin forming)